jgi:nicotinamidase-related amidase
MIDKHVLLIIDVQQGFINERTHHVPAAVEALQEDYEHVIVTRFNNPEGSPYRQLIGWDRFTPGSNDTKFAFTPRKDAMIIDKSTYTCINKAFLAKLNDWDTRIIDLCGIATDNCVLKCAVDLFEAGRVPRILSSYCASHGGPDCHEAGLLLLRRLIGENQVI